MQHSIRGGDQIWDQDHWICKILSYQDLIKIFPPSASSILQVDLLSVSERVGHHITSICLRRLNMVCINSHTLRIVSHTTLHCDIWTDRSMEGGGGGEITWRAPATSFSSSPFAVLPYCTSTLSYLLGLVFSAGCSSMSYSKCIETAWLMCLVCDVKYFLTVKSVKCQCPVSILDNWQPCLLSGGRRCLWGHGGHRDVQWGHRWGQRLSQILGDVGDKQGME